jgi:hypothetical protein
MKKFLINIIVSITILFSFYGCVNRNCFKIDDSFYTNWNLKCDSFLELNCKNKMNRKHIRNTLKIVNSLQFRKKAIEKVFIRKNIENSIDITEDISVNNDSYNIILKLNKTDSLYFFQFKFSDETFFEESRLQPNFGINLCYYDLREMIDTCCPFDSSNYNPLLSICTKVVKNNSHFQVLNCTMYYQ